MHESFMPETMLRLYVKGKEGLTDPELRRELAASVWESHGQRESAVWGRCANVNVQRRQKERSGSS